MNQLVQSIVIAIHLFPLLAVCFTLPILLIPTIRYKKINFMRIGINYMMVFYFVCLFSLVFLPLPTAKQLITLNDNSIQLIPFRFVCDIIRETPFVISNIHTYLPALFHRAVLQVVFNVLMLVPFGMLLRYYFGFSKKKVILCSLLLSLFIEIGQLTGLFFIYPGSYRLCDVDDLIANTMGGYLGYRLIACFERYIPSLKAFDFAIPSIVPTHKHHLNIEKFNH